MKHYQNAENDLVSTNILLMEELRKINLNKLQLSSVGNSISTGFSFCFNMPLLKRNKTLEEIARNHNITLETHQFARLENNSDKHVQSWIMENIKESEFNKYSRRDYQRWIDNHKTLMTEEQINKFYKKDLEIDRGIRDVLFDKGAKLANIVILNGATGSLLDNWTRGGNHVLTDGIKKDCSYLEANLGIIENNNRKNNSNTQVYLCGAPRLFNLPFTSSLFINTKLKHISKRYSNVTFINSFPKQFLYKNNFTIPLPDPHYNKEEYLHLLEEVEKSIIDNYLKKHYFIQIDRLFSKESRDIEFSSYRETRTFILSILDSCANDMRSMDKDDNKFLREIQSYLLERYPHDYSFLDKNAICESAKILKKK